MRRRATRRQAALTIRGVVRGKVVHLRGPARLADGTEVVVRPAGNGHGRVEAASATREELLAFLLAPRPRVSQREADRLANEAKHRSRPKRRARRA